MATLPTISNGKINIPISSGTLTIDINTSTITYTSSNGHQETYNGTTKTVGAGISLGNTHLTINSDGTGSFSLNVGVVELSFDVENSGGNTVITKAELSATYLKVLTATIDLERDQETGIYSGTVSAGLVIPSKIPGSSYVNKFLDSKINPDPITFDPTIDNPCVLVGAESSFAGSACSLLQAQGQGGSINIQENQMLNQVSIDPSTMIGAQNLVSEVYPYLQATGVTLADPNGLATAIVNAVAGNSQMYSPIVTPDGALTLVGANGSVINVQSNLSGASYIVLANNEAASYSLFDSTGHVYSEYLAGQGEIVNDSNATISADNNSSFAVQGTGDTIEAAKSIIALDNSSDTLVGGNNFIKLKNDSTLASNGNNDIIINGSNDVVDYIVPDSGSTVMTIDGSQYQGQGTLNVGNTAIIGGVAENGAIDTWKSTSGLEYQFSPSIPGSNLGVLTISQGLLRAGDKIAIQNFNLSKAQSANGYLGIHFTEQPAIQTGNKTALRCPGYKLANGVPARPRSPPRRLHLHRLRLSPQRHPAAGDNQHVPRRP